MPADDGERRSGGDDPRTLDHSFGGPAAQRKAAVLRAPRFAHRGEAGTQCLGRVLGAHDDAPFLRLDRILPEIAARIAGQMDMQVDQPRDHGHGFEPDHLGPGGRWIPAALHADDAAIGDDDRRRPHRFAVGIDDDIAGMDHFGVGQRGRSGENGSQYGRQASDPRQRIGITHQYSPHLFRVMPRLRLAHKRRFAMRSSLAMKRLPPN